MRNRSMARRALPLLALGALAGGARADDGTHVGVALTAGASGIGADLGVGINDYLGVRATVSDFSISRTGNYGTSVSWDASLKLFQAGALLDVYPFAGIFHLSAGVVQDGNKFTLTGKPSGGSYTFNGNSYPAADIGSAAATVDWSKAVPYVGLGWGNLAGSAGWHFTTDLGALITGSPNASIAVTCSQNPTVQASGICAQLSSDVAKEQAKLVNNVHNITFWPVLRLGIGYAF